MKSLSLEEKNCIKFLRIEKPNSRKIKKVLEEQEKDLADTKKSWRRTKKYLGVMLKEGLLKENIDGEALSWSHERLIKRPEERKILIVISDGAPVDDSTLSSNREDFLDNHLKEIISEVENNSPVELQAIGIGHDVSKYYKNAITINRAEDLGKVLLDELTKLFNES